MKSVESSTANTQWHKQCKIKLGKGLKRKLMRCIKHLNNNAFDNWITNSKLRLISFRTLNCKGHLIRRPFRTNNVVFAVHFGFLEFELGYSILQKTSFQNFNFLLFYLNLNRTREVYMIWTIPLFKRLTIFNSTRNFSSVTRFSSPCKVTFSACGVELANLLRSSWFMNMPLGGCCRCLREAKTCLGRTTLSPRLSGPVKGLSSPVLLIRGENTWLRIPSLSLKSNFWKNYILPIDKTGIALIISQFGARNSAVGTQPPRWPRFLHEIESVRCEGTKDTKTELHYLIIYLPIYNKPRLSNKNAIFEM
jgi:hypothetical protein